MLGLPEITEIFVTLGSKPSVDDVTKSMPLIEKLVTSMYKSTTTCESVNDLRRELFIEENKDLESIPPTSAALFQHALRASYIAGYVRHQSLIPQPVLPTIEEWGWKTTDFIPTPYCTDLPEASAAIKGLIKCGCNPKSYMP